MMDHSQDQLENMSLEELQRLAQGFDQPATSQQGQEPAPQAAPAETPREERQEQQAHEETPPAAPAAQPQPAAQPEAPKPERGDPDVPLRHLREQLRQHQDQLDQFKRFANDPAALRQHLQAIDPGQAPDPLVDFEGAMRHYTAPLQQQVQTLQTQLAQANHQQQVQQYMAQMIQKHGTDFIPTLQAFDQQQPHLANLDPEVRYLTAKGFQAVNAKPTPAVDEAHVNALVEKRLADILASGQAPSGRALPTLGSAPQGKEERPAPTLDSLSQDQMENMSFADLHKLARGGQ